MNKTYRKPDDNDWMHHDPLMARKASIETRTHESAQQGDKQTMRVPQ
jgi:hypothetical protein